MGYDKSKYVLVAVEEYTNYVWVWCLNKKSDTSTKIKDHQKYIEHQFGTMTKIVRTDGGKEFDNIDLHEFYKNNGIVQEISAPYSHYQNGKAESHIKIIKEIATCLLLQSKLPTKYWPLAVETAAYIHNHTYSIRKESIPFEKLFQKSPRIDHLRVFGVL